MTKDPVCGMNVDEASAAGQWDHEGRTYYFCSPACQATFEAAPTRYASSVEPLPTRS